VIVGGSASDSIAPEAAGPRGHPSVRWCVQQATATSDQRGLGPEAVSSSRVSRSLKKQKVRRAGISGPQLPGKAPRWWQAKLRLRAGGQHPRALRAGKGSSNTRTRGVPRRKTKGPSFGGGAKGGPASCRSSDRTKHDRRRGMGRTVPGSLPATSPGVEGGCATRTG